MSPFSDQFISELFARAVDAKAQLISNNTKTINDFKTHPTSTNRWYASHEIKQFNTQRWALILDICRISIGLPDISQNMELISGYLSSTNKKVLVLTELADDAKQIRQDYPGVMSCSMRQLDGKNGYDVNKADIIIFLGASGFSSALQKNMKDLATDDLYHRVITDPDFFIVLMG